MKKMLIIMVTAITMLYIAGATSAATIKAKMTGHISYIAPSMIGRGLQIGDEVIVYATFDSEGTNYNQYNQAGKIINTTYISDGGYTLLSDATFDFSPNIKQAYSGDGVTLPTHFYHYVRASSGYLAFDYQGTDLYFHVKAYQRGGVFKYTGGDTTYVVSTGMELMNLKFMDINGSPIKFAPTGRKFKK